MPTGYTADVQSGKITDFATFAMRCARNFGALVMMRDDPMDAEIPERMEPSSYHQKAIAECEAKLAQLEAMTDAELESHVSALRLEVSHRNAERIERSQIESDRYKSMLKRAQQWQPPSKDHEGLKRFMCEQLETSIRFDCEGTYQEPLPGAPGDWRKAECARLTADVAYHAREHAKEVERTNKRNAWVDALRQSLAPRAKLDDYEARGAAILEQAEDFEQIESDWVGEICRKALGKVKP